MRFLFIAVPVQDPGSADVRIYARFRQSQVICGQSYLNYKDYRDLNQVFSALVLYSSMGVTLSDAGEPEPATAGIVVWELLRYARSESTPGRDFSTGRGPHAGHAPVAVISYGLWQRKYAADRESSAPPFTSMAAASRLSA